MFNLKDHAGIGPVKVPIKSDKTGRAVWHSSIYFSTFADLCVASSHWVFYSDILQRFDSFDSLDYV